MKKAFKTVAGLVGGCLIALIVAMFVVMALKYQYREKVIAYKQSLKAMGETLDPELLAPPPPPTEGNGAEEIALASKELRKLAGNYQGPKLAFMPISLQDERHIVHLREKAPVQDKTGRNYDVSWDEAMESHGEFAGLIERIHSASMMPILESKTPAPTDSIKSDWKIAGTIAAHFAADQAIICLAKKNVPAAVNSVETSLAIARTMLTELSFFSRSLASACVISSLTPTWEILNSEEVATPDLARLQSAWENIDLTRKLADTFRIERASGMQTFGWETETMEESYLDFSKFFAGGESAGDGLLRKASIQAWSMFFRYHDEMAFLKSHQTLIEKAEKSKTSGAWLNIINSPELTNEASGLPHRLWTEYTIPSIVWTTERIVEAQVVTNMSVCVIALRRYQIDHGEYPKSLEVLLPKYLAVVPNDVFDGHPLKYERGGEGGFLLYSVGKNGVDEKGDTTIEGNRKDFVKGRDIVWPHVKTVAEQ